MASTWKDAESVFYWINAIGREFNFPFPKNLEEKQQLYKDLYPKMIADAVHSDFESEMENFLDHGAFGNIRFRFEDYYGFKTEVKNFFIQWLVQHHTLPQYPQRSYFIMARTMNSVTIREENGKIVFSLQDDQDKYPIVIRFSKKQIFLLKPFLEANELDPSLLNGPLDTLAENLCGYEYYVLKYMNSFDSHKLKPIYWTYSLFSHDPAHLEASFVQSVEGKFLPSFHPEELPMPNVPTSSVYCSKSIQKVQIRTNGMGHLIAHYQKGNIALSIKGELIGFIQNGHFDWLCSPRPELVPFIEQLWTQNKEAS